MAHLPLPQPELAVKVPQHLHSPATGTRPTSSRVPSSVPRLTQTPTKALRFALDPQSSSLEPSPTQAPHRGVIPSTPGEVSACRDPSRSSYSTRVARRSPQSTHAQTPVLLSRSKQSVARKPHACPFERCSFTSNAELILHDHMAEVHDWNREITVAQCLEYSRARLAARRAARATVKARRAKPGDRTRDNATMRSQSVHHTASGQRVSPQIRATLNSYDIVNAQRRHSASNNAPSQADPISAVSPSTSDLSPNPSTSSSHSTVFSACPRSPTSTLSSPMTPHGNTTTANSNQQRPKSGAHIPGDPHRRFAVYQSDGGGYMGSLGQDVNVAGYWGGPLSGDVFGMEREITKANDKNLYGPPGRGQSVLNMLGLSLDDLGPFDPATGK